MNSTHPAESTPTAPIHLDILRGRSILVILILFMGDVINFGFVFWLATSIRSWLIPVIGGV